MPRSPLVVLLLTLAPACRPCPTVPPDRAWSTPAPVVTRAPAIPAGAVRLAIGGDSRRSFDGDTAGRDVLPWAFETAGRAGARAFVFLGDMERTPPADSYFRRDLAALPLRITFCPVFGNHEALVAGVLDLYPDDMGQRRFVGDFLGGCVGREQMPSLEARADAGRVYYGVDLPGEVHLVALDNVSPALGFGAAQLAWMAQDLAEAHARGQRIIVAMHKALAGNGVTGHSMDEDEDPADPGRVRREAAAARALFARSEVSLIVASHEHGYWELAERDGSGRPIHAFITGGLGAPLRTCAGPDHAFFHLLLVDVSPAGIAVTTVRRG
jgi:3',5'-cyclic AMP phosphodiesterase CpdA